MAGTSDTLQTADYERLMVVPLCSPGVSRSSKYGVSDLAFYAIWKLT